MKNNLKSYYPGKPHGKYFAGVYPSGSVGYVPFYKMAYTAQ